MSPRGLDTVSPQVLGTDIEYSLQSNALSAKSVLGGRVALTPSKGNEEGNYLVSQQVMSKT